MMSQRLKLYVWEDVLRDWTAGMVVVLAPSEKEAWRVLKKEYELEYHQILGIEPKEVDHPAAFVVWGGS